MEHAVEHVEAIKGSEEELRKINKVRKHKRLMLTCEFVGSSGVTLKSYGRDINEVSSTHCVSL